MSFTLYHSWSRIDKFTNLCNKFSRKFILFIRTAACEFVITSFSALLMELCVEKVSNNIPDERRKCFSIFLQHVRKNFIFLGIFPHVELNFLLSHFFTIFFLYGPKKATVKRWYNNNQLCNKTNHIIHIKSERITRDPNTNKMKYTFLRKKKLILQNRLLYRATRLWFILLWSYGDDNAEKIAVTSLKIIWSTAHLESLEIVVAPV